MNSAKRPQKPTNESNMKSQHSIVSFGVIGDSNEQTNQSLESAY